MKRNEDVEWMFNIMRDNKIFRSSKIVMVYNCDNLQASNIRNDVYEDYLAYLNFENKQIWEKVALYNLYLQCKRHYPIECHNLYPNTKSILLYILLYYCKIANKISKIFFDTY